MTAGPVGFLPRSYLYVPGDQPSKLAKAAGMAVDAIIVDLEDAVAPARKADARGSVREWLGARTSPSGDDPQVWVRVNTGPEGGADVAAVTSAAISGVVLAKAEAASVRDVSGLLDDAERTRGLRPGSIDVIALVETALGVLEALAIATSARVARLALGEVDLAAELGITASDDGRELLAVRTQLVLASAAGRLPPPIGPVCLAARDLELLRGTSRDLRGLGFGARQAIHPGQVPVIEQAFGPTVEEIGQAQTLLAAYDDALAAGQGVFLTAAGQMVDEAVIRTARRVAAFADGSAAGAVQQPVA